METYTEYDTEQARQAERSSAGLSTQRLQQVPALANTALGRNNLPALALIGLGVLWLLGGVASFQLELTAGMILLTIASCFLFFAFWKRIYGLLIPGCIIAGLSLGITFVNLTNGASILWGLALGFLALPFLGKTLFNVNSNWGVYPAIPLFAVGVLIAILSMPSIFAGALLWLPLMLIGAGLYLGWGRNRP